MSFFPRLNHCKNHYYFEMMRGNGCIDSNEWFVPEGWERGTVQELLEEKQVAVKKAAELLEALKLLEDKIEKEEYRRLWIKFYNLKLITEIWLTLTKVFVDYAKYFEKSDNVRLTNFEKDVNRLLELNGRGLEQLGEKEYCIKEIDAGKKEFIFPYIEETGNDSVRIRFDKIAGEMPCIFTIKVKMEE